ncbi:two component transcriptional regulator, LuxR family [Longilinea arvoryzae]|uniref:Two component transcriptional regulator, LuxR family n=1 Tax=Longilinea arvoryzae TaxID=360412 RepID=A0A0S7BGZ7_9CHLR|nr:response regulator transcription factor [Longilinea arvoryzae]GAP14356.1 two component transcriptional regulator, LuxR family [Longilinea arvoryzae]
METSITRIVLVEDHQIVREGTRQLLEQVPDFRVVGEAADGLESIGLVERLQPDVVIMDIRLPRMNGIEATQIIKERFPDVEIIILSAYEDDCYIFPLLEKGASGYLLKTSSGKELEHAIRTVRMGETALDPRIAHKVVQRINRRQLYRSAEMQEGLTQREMEVLRAAAQGKSNKEIAIFLSISAGTVQVHFRNIFEKLGVTSRTEAVTNAIGKGWISLDENER